MDDKQLRQLRQIMLDSHQFIFVLTQPHNDTLRQTQIALLDNPDSIAKLTRLREQLRAAIKVIEAELKDTD